MPWEETPDYIRSGHREPGDTCRTITISATEGIKAIYCRYGDSWAIQSYLFQKDHGWTMSKAKTWFAAHQGEALNLQDMHLDFKTVLKNYARQYGEDDGEKRFLDWLGKYELDPMKPYSNQAQLYECIGGLCEAFRWAEPMIQLYREDTDATYWKVKALTANISMNRRDYTDTQHLRAASPTLTWRPLDWNHDHGKWLPFPEARVDWAAYEDKAAESIIRIPNDLKHYSKNKLVNQMIRDGDILHVSVEGEPRGGSGKAPEYYNFTALALLEKDVTLPGDPLTSIEPLFMRESLGRSLVESLRMEKIVEGKTSEKNMNEKEAGTHSEAQWNPSADWPDSCFLHVPDSAKGADGRKSERKLPVKWPNGDVDCPHVLAAITALQGARGGTDLPDNLTAQYLKEAQNMYRNNCNPDYKPGEKIGEGIGGMDACGQCRSFQDLSNATVTIEHSTGGDSVGITRTEGALGPGVGRCSVTEKLVRKQDPACTDGRPRESATDLDRTMEDVKHLAEKSELLKEIVFEKKLLHESRGREDAERQAKIKALQEIAAKDEENAKVRRELAEQTGISAKLKEEMDARRKVEDELKEQNVRFKIGMENSDRDIKLYKDQNDRYERSVQKLNEEVVTVKEELTKALTGKNDETAKRVEAVQRANNAENDKSRIQTESALIMQQLSEKTAEISDYARRLSDSAARELKLQRELQENREDRGKLVEEIRDLKQKLSRSPKEINIQI